LVEHCLVVVIKLNSRYKDILDITTIWVGTEHVVISRRTCSSNAYYWYVTIHPDLYVL